PLLVIGLMTLAIVFNPLPSAPIAIASGAVYGHTLGTVYIVAGAEIGAVIAFMIARVAGYQFMQKYIGENASLSRFTTQNSLMAIVFVSRLVPFLSFDLISYGAGLTPISLWRFALATLLGLLPISFLLAHYGGKMVGANFQSLSLFVLAIGFITVIPFLFKGLWKNRNKDQKDR
ncbi:MAG: TVP38/TMEM64 family protein, partial [Gammaproteobacteria bacterium]